MDEQRQQLQQEIVGPQAAPPLCVPGFAHTCTIQCQPGGALPPWAAPPPPWAAPSTSRILPGVTVEACAVIECSCQPPTHALHADGLHFADPTLPLALVIFGLRLARP